MILVFVSRQRLSMQTVKKTGFTEVTNLWHSEEPAPRKELPEKPAGIGCLLHKGLSLVGRRFSQPGEEQTSRYQPIRRQRKTHQRAGIGNPVYPALIEPSVARGSLWKKQAFCPLLKGLCPFSHSHRDLTY